MKRVEQNPSIIFSIGVLLLLAFVFAFGMMVDAPTASLLIVIVILLHVVALCKGIPYKQIEHAMTTGIKGGTDAMVILMIVGIIIATWIQSGLVPMIIYYGLGIVRVEFLLPVTFLLCVLLSVCTGTSWGSCGTIGIACVSIGESMGIPTYIVAAAAISGATVGDKISPFSDTTVFASSITGVNIYKHIRAMLYTTLPTCVLTFIVYCVLGTRWSIQEVDISVIENIRTVLAQEFHFSPLLWILPIAVLIMTIKKVPAILSLLFSGLLGCILSITIQGNSITNVLTTLNEGFVSQTGIAMIDSMLSKGGLISMLPTVCTIVLAMSVGGIVSEMRVLNTLINKLKSKVKSDENMVLLTLCCGIIIVLSLSSLYVTAVLLKEVFEDIYEERGIDKSVLSRSIEESTTITTPLIPWHSSFIYYTNLFQLSTLAFVPYTVFCWLNIVVSMVMTKTKILSRTFRPKDSPKANTAV